MFNRAVMEINSELKQYIEEFVLPQYVKNEEAHGINHINDVIRRSFEIVEKYNLDVNPNIVYVVAAYHDLGHFIDPEIHEFISANMMEADNNLKRFFSEDEIKVIREAIEDHRASSKDEPRSIYGKIVSSADRNNTVEACLGRTYSYGKKKDPKATDEELFERAHSVLLAKFGEGGYAKNYYPTTQYEQFLLELRELLSDKERYIDTQRKYIKSLTLGNRKVD